MRTLLAVTVLSLTACVPMREVRGSSLKYLTTAGATLELGSPAAQVEPMLEQLMGDRGFTVTKRATAKKGKVTFFAGNRDRINRRWQQQLGNPVSREIGSWFAVRVVSPTPESTTLVFYGKPTVHGAEGCGDGDGDLRDADYTCLDLRLRAEWSGFPLVEGREETQVISAIIALLGEQFPPALK
ncbi:MAG: hypothetical protein ACOZQL_42585 [Myxococcota bacterium]